MYVLICSARPSASCRCGSAVERVSRSTKRWPWAFRLFRSRSARKVCLFGTASICSSLIPPTSRSARSARCSPIPHARHGSQPTRCATSRNIAAGTPSPRASSPSARLNPRRASSRTGERPHEPCASAGYAVKLGYLVSQYPALNHSYVLREVHRLRRRGIDVRVVSVRRCDRPLSALNAVEAEEAARTFSVIGAGALHTLLANMRTLVRHPLGYVRGLTYAWRLSRGTPKLIVMYTVYFLEGVVAGDYFERHGVSD